jgi:hydroxyacylglutathione hydrolase
LITGFPAGMLQCNCYVLAERPGTDAVIVDPGQRAMAPLRRILDENRLTPAAVLLTHGHIDHMWSAQKVSDTYGCPTYIHPEDRFMLKDPIHGLGPRLAQVVTGAFFREPKQVVELDRDGDKLDLGSVTVNVDHTPGHTRGRSFSGLQRTQTSCSPATRCSNARSAEPTCSAAAAATC